MNESELKKIRNILTLRYDPEEQSSLQERDPYDYSISESDPKGYEIENRLRVALFSKLNQYDTIGISLSSGVDSSLILALIKTELPNKKIIAYHYTGVNNDELEASKKLAKRFGAEFVTLKPSPVIDRIDFMMKMMDAPKWDAYDYVIPEQASKDKCDILVSGDGSDELFAGYTFRYEKFLSYVYSANEGLDWISEKVNNYLQCHNHDFVADQENLLIGFDWDLHIIIYLWRYFSNGLGNLQQVLLADYNGKLVHNFTVKKDKFSKQFNIPIYSPFLEEPIINFATHLPISELYKDGVGKLPLREICKRYQLFPPTKKLGFTHDIKSEWMSYATNYVKPLFDDNALIYKLNIINKNWVEKNFRVPMPFDLDERIINKLVSLYTLEKYLQWKN